MIKKISLENFVLAFIGLTFFIGIWHAFPMFNVIGDEMYYVGGVLRAMEKHTIVPLRGDVPYGTLTYLLNYFFTIIILGVLIPFFKFKLVALKLFLVKSPTLMYLSRRFVSAVIAVGLMIFVNKILKKEFEDLKTRLFILILLFTNIITSVVLHTGKMWVLSMFLVVVSFYYLYQSLELKLNKNIFLSILFSFLAFSNFPLNFYCLINIPVLLFYFRKERYICKKIILYSLVGFFVFVLVTLLNFNSIKDQVVSVFTVYHPILNGITSKLNFVESSWIYFIKLLSLYPLLLLSIILSVKDGIKNKKLFITSILYFSSYFLIIVLVANWSGDLKTDLRYLFPLGFFLTFILTSMNIRFKKVFYVIGTISIIYLFFILYYLSIPTTYNQAFNWIHQNLADKQVIIVNKVAELQLTKNDQSSLVTKTESCATKCQTIINFDLNSDFRPFVVDLLSKDVDLSSQKNPLYYISERPLNDISLEKVVVFDNPSSNYHSVEYNVGSYFDLDLFKIKNFGKNIYIYKKI